MQPCLTWIEAVNNAKASAFFLVVAIIVTIYFGKDHMPTAVIGTVCSAGLAFLTKALFKKSDAIKVPTATSTTPVIYHGWNGTIHSFSLSNREFHDRFCMANQKKLINY